MEAIFSSGLPGGSIVKTSQASTAKDVDLIPGQGIKIPQAGL